MPPHPGQIIAENLLLRCGLSAGSLADAIEVAPSLLVEILAERMPVTQDLAERLGCEYGPSAAYWLALQAAWDREQRLVHFTSTPEKAT